MKASALALALSLSAFAALAPPPVEVAQPWSRPAVAGSPGAGYMTLANHGATPEILVKVESPLARKVEVHQSSMSGGMASMRPVERLTIPPGGSVAFAPGGYHLMFVGLAKSLKSGDVLPATLTFASGAKVKAAFAVTAQAPVMDHMHH